MSPSHSKTKWTQSNGKHMGKYFCCQKFQMWKISKNMLIEHNPQSCERNAKYFSRISKKNKLKWAYYSCVRF